MSEAIEYKDGGANSASSTPPADDVSTALLREQYRSLTVLVPFLYVVVLVTTLLLTFATRDIATPLVTVGLPLPMLCVVVSRMFHWVKARKSVEVKTTRAMRRDMLNTTILGPALTFGFTIIASISIPHGESVTKLLVLVFVWIAAMACAFCLFALPRAALLVVLSSSLPLAGVFISQGTEIMTLLALVLLMISGLIGYMLKENFRNFAEIVHSRFALAEKRRQADSARRDAEAARDAATATAQTDPLTGLPNRRHFELMLAERTREFALAQVPFAVGMLDLDGFKPVNDVYGHATGDAVLREVADRLRLALLGGGRLARMGGDEFAVIVEGVGTAAEAIARGHEIQAHFLRPFFVGSTAIRLNTSCGFCLHESASDDPGRLLDRADMALYRGKGAGRGGVAVFDVVDENLALERARIEAALRAAVASETIEVHFQPIVDLKSGRIHGFESLARWTDPDLGSISPSVFIPLAEQIGLIEDITDQLLRKAARHAADWPESISLSFNISPEQLSKPRAGANIVEILAEAGLPVARFEAEVTETAIMRDLDGAKLTIEFLRAAGARVALDDFGTGFSSLNQIRLLSLDRIKIDKSFVDDICDDPRIATLVRSLIDMCRSLDLDCVAEGIEKQDQLLALKLDGCHWGQGFLISRPVTPDAARVLALGAAREAA